MRRERGFSLIEMMIGLVIFLVGVIGFAGMTAMQAQGNRVAKGSDEASTLLQSAVEDYSAVMWSNLGTDASAPGYNGLSGGEVLVEGPINKLGQPQGTGTGPYSYYRASVVCSSATAGIPPGGNPMTCGSAYSGSYRPPQLACSNLSPALSPREKMIRILVSWTDRNGQCHFRTSNSLSFNWAG